MNTTRGVALKWLADVINRGAGLITFPIIARYAGVDGYGAFSQVNTVVGFIVPFASLGIAGAMVRFFSAQPWNRSARSQVLRLLTLTGGLSAAAALAAAVTAPDLNRWFLNWEQGTDLFRWGAALILAGSLEQLLLDFFRARQWIAQLSVYQILQAALVVAATGWLLPAGLGLVPLIQATLLIKVLGISALGLSFWTWCRPAPDCGAPAVPSTAKIIAYGLPVVVSGLGLWMVNLGDRLVIGHFMSPEALGVYAAVYSVSALVLAVNAPLNLPLYPRLMQAVSSGDRELVTREVRLFHRYSTLIIVPSTVFLGVAMKPLLVLLSGPEFHAGYALTAMILAVFFLDQWNSIAHYALMCFDQVVFSQNVWFGMGLFNLAANWWAVPRFGLEGAALVSLLTFLVLETVVLIKANRSMPLISLYRFDITWRAALASLAGSAAAWIWLGTGQPQLSSLGIGAGVFWTAYAASLAALGVIGRAEIRQVMKSLFIGR